MYTVQSLSANYFAKCFPLVSQVGGEQSCKIDFKQRSHFVKCFSLVLEGPWWDLWVWWIGLVWWIKWVLCSKGDNLLWYKKTKDDIRYGLNIISNENRNSYDPKEVDDPQVFESMIKKEFQLLIYVDTSIFDGLVLLNIWVRQNEIIIYSLFWSPFS